MKKDKYVSEGPTTPEPKDTESKIKAPKQIWRKEDLLVKRNQLEDYEIQLIDLNRGLEASELAIKHMVEHPKLALRRARLNLKQIKLRKSLTERNLEVIKKQIIKINRNFKE